MSKYDAKSTSSPFIKKKFEISESYVIYPKYKEICITVNGCYWFLILDR